MVELHIEPMSIPQDGHIEPGVKANNSTSLHVSIMGSKDKLFINLYTPSVTMMRRWCIIQVMIRFRDHRDLLLCFPSQES